MELLGDPKDRNLPVQRRIQLAGLNLIVDDGWGILLRGLDKRRVAERAGLSRTTVHQQYADHEAMVEAIVSAAFSEDILRPYVDRVDADIASLIAERLTDYGPAQGVREVGRLHLEMAMATPMPRLHLILIGFGHGTDLVSSANRALYAVAQENYERLFSSLLAHWGVDLVPPMTPAVLSLALTALVEGFHLRALCDPTASPEAFGICAERIIIPNVAPIAASASSVLPDRSGPTSTAQIMEGAAGAADEHGTSTALRHVAERCGVRETFLAEEYTSMAGLVTAYWSGFALGLREIARRDTRPAAERLELMLGLLADHVVAHRGMATLYVMGALADGRPSIRRLNEDPIAGELFEPLREWPHHHGRATGRPEVRRMALTVVHALITNVLIHPRASGADAEAHAAASAAAVCAMFGIDRPVEAER
jgi:AcrR family transcriptional regulator